MRIDPESPSGKLLRSHGVSANALVRTRIFSVRWLPGIRMTVPLPFLGTAIFLERSLLIWDTNKELAKGSELAPLVHQLCHAHQRLEWGFFFYIWRHLWARIIQRGSPIRFSQVERECFQAALQTVEYYNKKQNYGNQTDTEHPG
jgi:hypothetical protein